MWLRYKFSTLWIVVSPTHLIPEVPMKKVAVACFLWWNSGFTLTLKGLLGWMLIAERCGTLTRTPTGLYRPGGADARCQRVTRCLVLLKRLLLVVVVVKYFRTHFQGILSTFATIPGRFRSPPKLPDKLTSIN